MRRFKMPFYDLKCKTCLNEFNSRASIKERENNEIECPKCKGKDHDPVFKTMNYVINKRPEMPACPNAGMCGRNCSVRH